MKLKTSLTLLVLVSTAALGDEKPVLEPLQEYLDFAEYSAGAITPEQVHEVGLDRFFVVDTRSRGQFEASHIPGAINIEWRQILAQRDRIPGNESILLYCDTGLLSSKAHLALALAGYENWVIWKAGADRAK